MGSFLIKQKTLADKVDFEGIGLHTGERVLLRFLPAPADKGVIFRRTDLVERPEIPATIEYVQDTSRSTNIGLGDVRIHTIEHVLAAVRASEIDNLVIELSASEPPVGDGSSLPFLRMIELVGTLEQESEREEFFLKEPVYLSEGDIHMCAIPSSEYRISYTLHYPEAYAIRSQFCSLEVTEETFRKEIAPCRTFSHYREISYLIDQGLIKGGSLDNAVVVMDDVVLSKDGLHFPDEMVRHKVLDLIGDLSLVGFPFRAHVIAIRSGHASNVAFAKKIFDSVHCVNSNLENN